METQPVYQDDKALAQFRESDAAIAQMRLEFSGLTIDGLDDKDGYASVREARLTCVRTRSAIEKTRKALKADALEFGRKVDGEAARLERAILEIEAPLKASEEAYIAEKARLQREAEEKAAAERKAKLDDRVARVVAYGPLGVPVSVIESMTDQQFAEALEATRVAHAEARAVAAELERRRAEDAARAEADRKAAEAKEALERAQREAEEAEARKAKEAALAQERAALKAQRLQQEAEAKRLADERAANEAEARRLAEVAAAAKAKEDEARAAAELEARAKAEQERLAALAPEIKRVEAYLDAVLEVKVPDGVLAARASRVVLHAVYGARAEIRR